MHKTQHDNAISTLAHSRRLGLGVLSPRGGGISWGAPAPARSAFVPHTLSAELFLPGPPGCSGFRRGRFVVQVFATLSSLRLARTDLSTRASRGSSACVLFFHLYVKD